MYSLRDMSIEIGSITTQTQININEISLELGITLMLSKKLMMPSSVTIGAVYRSTIVTSAATVIVRAFLRKLSFIKNIGNKMLVIIVDIEPIKNTAFQLIFNTFKVEVSCTRNLASIIPADPPIVIARLVIKTYK